MPRTRLTRRTKRRDPEDAKARVFDKYARLDMADKKIAGTGLGLAICKAIIEAQGGQIGVRTAESGGAIFWFTLPEVKG